MAKLIHEGTSSCHGGILNQATTRPAAHPTRWRILGLLCGRISDLVGAKRVMLTGLLLFTAASLATGLAECRRSR